VKALTILAIAAAVGLLIALTISFVVRRVGSLDRTRLLGAIDRRCAVPLRVLLPLVGMLLVVPSVGGLAGLPALLPRVLSIAAIAATGWLAVRAVHALVDHVAATHRIDHADNFAARQVQTQTRLLARVAVVVIVIATAAGMLLAIPGARHIGVSLFASAGIAGLAAGLAARPALGNLIAGIQIALTQPIRLEDAVVVEGEWGWIEEINMTFVVVRIWDLRRLVLPISYFIETPFQNWTRTTADILGSVFLHVDYSVPLAEIRSEFAKALRDSKYWDGKVEVVHVTECTEKTMQIRLLMSAPSSPDAWELRCEVRERLITYLQQQHPRALPRVRLEDIGTADAQPAGHA
jgi:small-conductance mechanosensitive channel